MTTRPNSLFYFPFSPLSAVGRLDFVSPVLTFLRFTMFCRTSLPRRRCPHAKLVSSIPPSCLLFIRSTSLSWFVTARSCTSLLEPSLFCPPLLPCVPASLLNSYIVVKDDDTGERPASLYDLEFIVNVNGEAIDQSLAYLAER